ncbi:MAG: chorismate mutase [Hyphomicrobiales bacterium]|nr:chorismate mutase [Hyphomicrobiales bacterium]
MTQPPPDQTLAALRQNIDRIDSDVHRLLMERGEIIEALIAIKARQGGGSAFRPGREAEMMRRIVSRHQGILPVDTVESIWRIIISTFTFVQAHYAVHVDVSTGEGAMRDSTRFHFGYSPPFIPERGADAVIAAVAQSGGDLGLVRVNSSAADGPWWNGLSGDNAPKIIARLPFVERPDHPAGTPIFVIAKPLAEAAATDVELFTVQLDRWREPLSGALGAQDVALVGNAPNDYGLSLLLAAPGPGGRARVERALIGSGVGQAPIAFAGSHAARFEHAGNV